MPRCAIFIVAAAFLTYLIDRDDVVWRFVKDSAAPQELQRALFTVATLFIVVGAGICTWAPGHHRPESTTGRRAPPELSLSAFPVPTVSRRVFVLDRVRLSRPPFGIRHSHWRRGPPPLSPDPARRRSRAAGSAAPIDRSCTAGKCHRKRDEFEVGQGLPTRSGQMGNLSHHDYLCDYS